MLFSPRPREDGPRQPAPPPIAAGPVASSRRQVSRGGRQGGRRVQISVDRNSLAPGVRLVSIARRRSPR